MQTHTLDKLQLQTLRLANTVHGFFSGDSPAHTIDAARAISQICLDLKWHMRKDEHIRPLLLEYEDGGNFSEVFRKTSNYSKHARKEDAYKLIDINERTASHALMDTIDDYRTLISAIREADLLDEDLYSDNIHLSAEHGPQHAIDIICNIFMLWDAQAIDALGTEGILDRYSDDQHLLFNFFHADPDEQPSEEDAQASLSNMKNCFAELNRHREKHHTIDIKRKYRNMIEEAGIYPLPPNAGIAFTKNGPIEFKMFLTLARQNAPTKSDINIKPNAA